MVFFFLGICNQLFWYVGWSVQMGDSPKKNTSIDKPMIKTMDSYYGVWNIFLNIFWNISDNVALFSCIFSPSIKIYRVSFCICSFIDGEYKQHCYLLKKQLILGLVPDCSINAISLKKKTHIQMYRLVPQVTVVHWKMLTWSWSLKIVDGWRLLQGI